MWDFLTRLFDPSGFPARWRCGSGWAETPWLGWLHILSDLGVWAAYFLIPCVLAYYALRRRNMPFRGVVLLFVAFILACGTTHLMEAIIFWWPAYRLSGALKLVTAIVSWATVFALVRVTPRLMAFRSPAEMEEEIRRLKEREAADRKVSEASLRANVKRFRAVFEASSSGLILVTHDGNISLANARIERMFGYTMAELLDLTLERLIPERYRSQHPAKRSHYFVNPQTRAMGEGRDLWGLRKDGSEFPVEIGLTPVEMESGLCVLASIVDISARRKAEDTLRQNEAMFHQLADSIPQLAWTARPDGHIFWYNQRWYDYTGTTPDQMEGWGWQSVHDPEELPKVLEVWQSSIATGESFEMVFPLRRQDGQFRSFLTRIIPLRNSEGEVLQWFGTNTNIDDQKRMEDRLRSSESRIRSIIDNILEGIVCIDEQGRIESINPGAERLFGYTAMEVVGQNVRLLMPEPYRSEHDSYLANYLSSGKAKIIGIGREVVGRRQDGSTFPMELAVSEFHLGQQRHFTGIVRDISDRKLAESNLLRTTDELRNSNLDLEQFAYVASHDLQEPLRAVSGCVQVLNKRYHGKLDSRADELVTHIVDGVSRMQNLINDLLFYSRLGTHGKVFALCDGNAALDRAIANLETSVKESGAVVTCDQLPSLSADAGQLTHLFQNLISNAIKFQSTAPPRIHIGAERQDRKWLLSVKDNGIGMQPEYFDRIFVIFQRLHTRTEYPGTGIGLAICKKIVERHGGCMTVESEPGVGSKFSFTIPDRKASPNEHRAVQGG